MTSDSKPVIVIAGSLHYDIMVDAPDRPLKGETVTGHAWRPKFGGKGGNQAVAAARAGADARMWGAVGDDDFGRFLLDSLRDGGTDARHVAVLPKVGSGMSVAIADREGDYGAVIVSGANLLADPSGLADEDLWRNAGALILQNEMPEALNLAAARQAKAAGALVCLNAAPFRPLSAEFEGMIDLLIVNAIEAEQSGGGVVDDLTAAAAAAERLASRFPSVVVTAGGDGVAGLSQGGAPVVLPALPVKLISTHGAGDVFVGTLVTELTLGASFAAALDAANHAAARHVSTLDPAAR